MPVETVQLMSFLCVWMFYFLRKRSQRSSAGGERNVVLWNPRCRILFPYRQRCWSDGTAFAPSHTSRDACVRACSCVCVRVNWASCPRHGGEDEIVERSASIKNKMLILTSKFSSGILKKSTFSVI